MGRVVALKGDLAVLQRPEGEFTAHINAQVNAGETLLLKLSGTRQGRPHYRIMARLSTANDQAGYIIRDSGEPLLIGLQPSAGGDRSGRPAALVRYLPRHKAEGERSESPGPLIELFIDTDHFGLILAQFFMHQEKRLECRFLVESPEAGKALQAEADKLAAEIAGPAGERRSEPLKWSVGNLRRTAAEMLQQGGLGFNAKA